jgi:hypothetical protein
MDIHKPKPIRNLREFLKEVGIIVLGVCIALSAEQAVEWAHWRGQVAVARQSLRAEMRETAEFYAYRVAISPCVDRQITTVDQAIRDIAAKRKPAPVNISVRGIGGLISDSEWQSERSAQTLTHFPRAELALMGTFYAQVPGLLEWETKQAEALWHLRILETDPETLDPADLAQLRLSLQMARHYEYLIEINGRAGLKLSERLGVAGVKANPVRVNNFCTLSDAGYARYQKSLGMR